MSCFVRIATRLTDEATLREALPLAGYKIAEKTNVVRGWNDQDTTADLVVQATAAYDIGAVRTKDGSFEFVADWSMAGVNQQAFVGKVTQAYSKVRVTAAAKKSGFVIAKEQVDEKGNVKLLLRRFV